MYCKQSLLDKLSRFSLDTSKSKAASIVQQEDQLCASMINQIVKVSDEHLKSKVKSRGTSIVRPQINEVAELRKVLFRSRSAYTS